MDFDVDGMRADITMYQAAIALAAYEGRTQVVEDDVRRVARLVLPHRRRRQPFDQPDVDEQQLEDSLERHRPPQSDNQTTPTPSTPLQTARLSPAVGRRKSTESNTQRGSRQRTSRRVSASPLRYNRSRLWRARQCNSARSGSATAR